MWCDEMQENNFEASRKYGMIPEAKAHLWQFRIPAKKGHSQ